VSREHDLVIERTFAAAQARVFEAWTSPEVLRRWWGAGPDWTSPAVEIDLRPGGRYRLSMQDPSGVVRSVGGEYVEVDPPRRLVYTWAWESHGAENDAATLVTVEFREVSPGQTAVILTHTGFADGERRDLHREGWELCLDNLATRVLGIR
jgi:uncharacterized protein YndB with AHSA1/START domain